MLEKQIENLTAAVKELTSVLAAGKEGCCSNAPADKPTATTTKKSGGKVAEPKTGGRGGKEKAPAIDDVRRALSALDRDDAKELLANLGCNRLTEVAVADYAQLIADAKKAAE